MTNGGKLFCLETQDECLRYLRPCTCTAFTKAASIRRQVQQILEKPMPMHGQRQLESSDKSKEFSLPHIQ